jgi:ribosomal protein S12 methylthiotransferase
MGARGARKAMMKSSAVAAGSKEKPAGTSRKVGMVSLGCPKNLVDTERVLALLQEAGYTITPQAKEADLLLVNTCAFVQSAQEESIEAILEMARFKEEGSSKALVVLGCLPQRFGQELADQLPEVDAWLGVGQTSKVIQICQSLLSGRGSKGTGHIFSPGAGDTPEVLPRLLCTPAHYAYLKIAEGCRNLCSYCVIPSIRGDLQSRPLTSLLVEAEELAHRGVKELILVAQDLGNYGGDLIPPATLTGLLERLCRIEGLEWIRMLYMHPAHLPEGLISVWANEPKICPYLDLPIQHIGDQILKAMNRRVTSGQIRDLIDRLRTSLPHLGLRTTVLVGFPGEDEAQFSGLLDFIQEIEFDHLGVFVYSKEEGTEAARMKDQIPRKVKEARLQRLMQAQAAISHRKNLALIGTTQRILIDGAASPESPFWKGRTSRQAPEIDGVVYVSKSFGAPGEFMEVRIIEADTYDLVGEGLAGVA